ncbi:MULTISPECIES: trifunctional serine/threonine-protein kinase/ATP-binding protein/sensor histidine kinase [Pseudanabaena]|uniref:histidine kinase n=2 Tax=Pseudanabaena TaxID=1152 RepID=L8N1T4_9CYAN|nr:MULTISPECIES: AAA family ATPase [Pseudanabaena]ELS33044.1 multi-sensor signal transduction multi-kinase [Pseudanabaena biceps PCC 7429]MDG3494729.1 AAA family ATPase [Pseudanabaena catenata USMAC16]
MSLIASHNFHKFPQLAGYTIAEQIYNGSRTSVYRAIDDSNGRSVIVKLLQQDYPSFNELLKFRNQYTIAKKLDVSGIVRPYSLESCGNSYAIVMEDFGGISLQQHIQKQPLSLAEKLEIAIQITQILDELHQSCVIHKDIKPANILIHPETNQIKLIDFSIASLLPKETPEIKNPNGLEGTLAYIAPEQTGRMNRGIDYRTDFYSFGVTLYELFARQRPFGSFDPMELVHCHLAKIPPTIHQICPEIPVVLSDIVDKLMAKNAEERYQSASGLKYDLQLCLHQLQKFGEISNFAIGKRDIGDRFLIPEKLYGRESEVNLLLESFDHVANGATELMLVKGFSGIGKTAVVNEVHKPIVRQRGYFIKGKFDQFNRNIPFSAFVQAFRDLIGQLMGESDFQLQAWKTRLLEAVGENGQIIIDVIPELERIMGTQSPAPELTGAAAQNRFNSLLQKFIHVFAKPEHPLVLFLDDLQWADSASLNLIRVLMEDLETGYLFVIGAYRDNEVSTAHPLMLTLDAVSKTHIATSTIALQPLDQNSLNRLVADTLHCQEELAQPLTELLMQKTQGNPFFATQFLRALYQDGAIAFNANASHWQCDIAEVRNAALKNDVVEFMALQLQKLPITTQAILKLAACMGAQFDLDTLAIVAEQSSESVAGLLWVALQEGLILPQSEIYKFYLEESDMSQSVNQPAFKETLNYRFLHDRVQQAAYSLIPDDQKQKTHLTIGRLLQKNLSSLEQEENLFEILSHLNASSSLITDPAEKRELVHLNFAGCKRAKASTAYSAAVRYVSEAINLLPSDSWQTDHQLTLQIYETAAETAYLNIEFTAALQLIDTILQECDRQIDRTLAYDLSVQIYIAQDLQLKAIETGLDALKSLGVSLVDLTNWQDHLPQLPSEEGLITKPQMTDPVYLAALQILITITPPTHHVKPELFPAVVLTMVDLCDREGYSELAAYAYGIYGLLLCAVIGDLDAAHQSGKVALSLLEQYQARELRTKVNMLFAVFVCACKEAGNATLPLLTQGIEVGLEVADIEYVSYCIMAYFTHLFLIGKPLESLQEAQAKYMPILEQFKQEHCIEYSKIWLRINDKFINADINADINANINTNGSVAIDPREAEVLQRFENTHNHQCLFAFHLSRLIFDYTLGNYAIALDHAVKATASQDAAFGFLLTAAHTFYHSLASLASSSLGGIVPKATELELAIANQQKLQHLANHAPSNYLHKYELVSAEILRIQGEKALAMDFYDRAIAGAKANGYMQEDALANELAAKFYLDWGKEKIAAIYMQEAYYGYTRWGAKAKVEDLERRYPHLLQVILQQAVSPIMRIEPLSTIAIPDISIHASIDPSSSSTSMNAMMDFAALLKASQSISGTIEIDQLLHELTQVVLQNSGGDRCALILPNSQGEWQVAAIATPEAIELVSEALDGNVNVPVKLIQYVKNTKTFVAVDDCKTSLPVIGKYLTREQPKSLLCFPLLNQAKLIGILYLENRATSGVFTLDRVELLNFICSQAAISLENANLYRQEQITSLRLANLNAQLELQLVQIAESEAQKRAIIQAIPDMIFQVNRDGVYLDYSESSEVNALKSPNPSAQAEPIGKSLADYLSPELYQQKMRDIELVLKTGEMHVYNQVLTIDGKPQYEEVRVVPMGNTENVLFTIRNVTEQKQAEDLIQQKSLELEQALKELQESQLLIVQSEKMSALGNLVAGVAHEINNPVGSIVGNVSAAQSYINDLLGLIDLYSAKFPDPGAEILEELESIDIEYVREDLPNLIRAMKNGGDRIRAISNSLRTFSRADTDTMQIFDIHEGIDSTILILRHRLKANEQRPAIGVITEYGRVPALKCFPGQLNQVFMNILANAIDALDEASQNLSYVEIEANPNRITVQTMVLDNHVKITISDNGKGMSEEVKAKIFDHLFTTKGVGKGTGLGLAIAKQIIIEKHGGSIDVSSIIGRGTIFSILLPLRR